MMKIFLSAEIEGPVTSRWFAIQREFSMALAQLEHRHYGDELISIGIISILMREEFFADGAYKERIYYSKKRKDADVRLRIDYYSFLKASKEKRKEIYIDHILESIRSVGRKAGPAFQIEQLVEDVKSLLEDSCEVL